MSAPACSFFFFFFFISRGNAEVIAEMFECE